MGLLTGFLDEPQDSQFESAGSYAQNTGYKDQPLDERKRIKADHQKMTEEAIATAIGEEPIASKQSKAYQAWKKNSARVSSQLQAEHDAAFPQIKGRGFLDKVTDAGAGFAQGAVGVAEGALTLAGFDGETRQYLGDLGERLQKSKSDEANRLAYAASIRSQAAQDGGALEQFKASMKNLGAAPFDYASQAAGSLVAAAPAAIAGAFGAPAAAVTGIGVAAFGASALGSTKKERGDLVYQNAIQSGLSKEAAIKLGARAAETDANTFLSDAGSLALGAGEMVFGAGGALLKAGRAAKGAARANPFMVAGKTGTFEGTQEISQAVNDTTGANRRATEFGYDTPTWRGVVGKATEGAVLGFAMGGVTGAGGQALTNRKIDGMPDYTQIDTPAFDDAMNLAPAAKNVRQRMADKVTAAIASGTVLDEASQEGRIQARYLATIDAANQLQTENQDGTTNDTAGTDSYAPSNGGEDIRQADTTGQDGSASVLSDVLARAASIEQLPDDGGNGGIASDVPRPQEPRGAAGAQASDATAADKPTGIFAIAEAELGRAEPSNNGGIASEPQAAQPDIASPVAATGQTEQRQPVTDQQAGDPAYQRPNSPNEGAGNVAQQGAQNAARSQSTGLPQVQTDTVADAPAVDTQSGEGQQAPVEDTSQKRYGKDGKEIGQGGKPFKTRAGAKEAKQRNPMMRIVKVKNGFALAEKTTAQLAAEEKASKRLGTATVGTRGTPMAAHELIVRRGGLAPSERADMGIQGNVRIGNRSLFAGAGRGLTLERATEALIEEGYTQSYDHNTIRALIKRSLTEPQYTADGFETMAQREAQARYEDHLAAQQDMATDENYDPFSDKSNAALDDFTIDDLEDTGYSQATTQQKLEVAALASQLQAIGLDADSIIEEANANSTAQTSKEFYAELKPYLEQILAREAEQGGRSDIRQNASQQSGDGEGGTTRNSVAATSAPQGNGRFATNNQGFNNALNSLADAIESPALELTSRTASEERQAIADREAAARATDKEAKRQEEADRAASEQSQIAAQSVQAASTFELGGNALDNLTGQNAMFSYSPAFYSALSNELGKIVAKQQSVDGWLGNIQGLIKSGKVKADEVEWTGVNEWLKLQEGKVTKEQVMDYLNGNGVRVEEVTLSNKFGYQATDGFREFDTEADANKDRDGEINWSENEAIKIDDSRFEDDKYISVTDHEGNTVFHASKNDDGVIVDEQGEEYRSWGGALEIAEEKAQEQRDMWLYSIGDVEPSEKSGAKYSQYQLAGGENYREVLLTLPVRKTLTDVQRAELKRIFYKSKADAGNYKSSHWDAPNVLAHIRLNDRTDADGKRVLFVEEVQSDWGQDAKKKGIGNSIPNAPFIGNTDKWLTLALKRIIKLAADEGYDKVAFINGEQSADRYDLSKQIASVQYLDNSSGGVGNPSMDGQLGSGTLIARDHNDKKLIDQHISDPSQIEDYVGKEVAAKLFKQTPKVTRRAGIGFRAHDLSGIDLKVGGEGMKIFYDKIVPSAANTLLKKLGGDKLTMLEIDGASQPSFTITDKMREAAANGLPLFSQNTEVTDPSSPTLIQSAIEKIFGGIKDVWPKLSKSTVVVDTHASLPADVISIAVLESITAYHGSPYTFDKFTLEKINSGLGGQTFGYGLYFSSKKSLANHYKELLNIYKNSNASKVYTTTLKQDDFYISYQDPLEKQNKKVIDFSIKKIREELEGENGKKITKHMIDKGFIKNDSIEDLIKQELKLRTGASLSPKNKEQAKELAANGIAGITYIDNKSNQNYVVFDDAAIEILAIESREAGKAQAFYQPSTGKIYMIADRIKRGTEQSVWLHEVFHKRGVELLGKANMDALHSTVQGWKNKPISSIERQVYEAANKRATDAASVLTARPLIDEPPTNGTKEENRKWVNTTAEKLAKYADDLTGKSNPVYGRSVEHSGSAAGASSYFRLGQAELRVSLHSKGAFNSQFYSPVFDKQSAEKIIEAIEIGANEFKEKKANGRNVYYSKTGSGTGEFNQAIYDLELVTYAIEEAINRGVTPDLKAADSTVANWLARVFDAFNRALNKLLTGARTKRGEIDFSAKDLVAMAYGAAKLELESKTRGNSKGDAIATSNQPFDGIETARTPLGDTKTVTVDGKEYSVFNSDGKPIHPTVEGVRNFVRWFGDDGATDKQGRPLVLYHGTIGNISFSNSRTTWFSTSKEIAETYGHSLNSFYIKQGRSEYVDGRNRSWDDIDYQGAIYSTDTLAENAKSTGYDSLHIQNVIDSAADEASSNRGTASDIYVTFGGSAQFKSASDNDGGFDSDNESVYASNQPVNTKRDAEYMAAAKRGDMATAQRMVDETAMAAGYDTTETWRGEQSGSRPFVYQRDKRREAGIFTTRDKETAQGYDKTGNARRFYQKDGNILDLTDYTQDGIELIQGWAEESGYDFIDRYSGEEVNPIDAVLGGHLFDWEGDWSAERWASLQEYVNDKGYDVVRLNDQGFGKSVVSEVALNSTALKLADPITYDDAGNIIPLSERFNAASEDVRYSKVPSLARTREIAKTGKMPTDRKSVQDYKDSIATKLVDSTRPFDVWTRDLPDQGAAAVMISAKNRAGGMEADFNKKVMNRFGKPLSAAITEIVNASKAKGKVKMDFEAAKELVGNWASATYAPIANENLIKKDTQALSEAVAAAEAELTPATKGAVTRAKNTLLKRQAAIVDKRVIDPASQSLEIGLAGGYNNATAASTIKDIEASIDRKLLQQAAQVLYDMNAWKLDQDVKLGKVTAEMAATFDKSGKYVPLTGDPRSDESSADVFGTGSVNQGKAKAMQGRSSSLAQNGIDASFEQVQKTARYRGWADFKDALHAMYESAVAEHLANGDSLAQATFKATEDTGVKRSPETMQRPSDNVIIYRKNGESWVYDLQNEGATEALRSANVEPLHSILQKLAIPTRLMARMVTQFMPGFAFQNTVRDVLEKSENIRTRALQAYPNLDMNAVGRSMLKQSVNMPKMLKVTSAVVAQGTPLEGTLKLDPNNADQALLIQFLEDGGGSTWGEFLATDGKDLSEKLAKQHSLGTKAIEVLDVWNNSWELISSFTAYKALRDNGVDGKAAANAALELMNFRKGGTAMKPIKALYMFAQPIATGGQQLIQTLSTPRGKARFAAYMLAGMALYAMLRSGEDDEELGVNKMDEISNYTLERSIPIPMGDGEYLKVPIGFGSQMMAWTYAVNLVKLVAGKQTLSETATELLVKTPIKTFAPVAPSETSISKQPAVWMAQTLTPSFMKPVTNVALDRTAFGGTLTNGRFAKSDKANALEGKTNTPEMYKDIAKELASLGFDMYPEQVRELIRGWAVGPVNELIKAQVENPAKEARGKTPPSVFIDRWVLKQEDDELKRKLFYRHREDLDKVGVKAGLGQELDSKESAMLKLLEQVKKEEAAARGMKGGATRQFNKTGSKAMLEGATRKSEKATEDMMLKTIQKMNEIEAQH
jgi:hypothetical protein